MAHGLGADVTILEVDLERMRFLDITLHTAHTLYSSEAHLMELLPDGRSAHRRGARARARKRRSSSTAKCCGAMRPGSVLVDIAIDQGGCAETSRPTTHHDPVLRRGRRDALLRRQHARGLRAHRHAGADQRHLSLHRTARRSRPGRSDASVNPRSSAASMSWTESSPVKAVAEAHGLSWQKPKLA